MLLQSMEVAGVNDDRELLWRMYSENMTHVRHVETQRSTVTSVLITLSGAVLAFMAAQWKNDHRSHWGLSVLLMLVGVFGVLFTSKLYELYVEHKARARGFRKALAKKVPDALIEEIKAVADREWKAEVPWLRPIPVHALWLGPHLVMAGLGLLTLIVSIVSGAQ